MNYTIFSKLTYIISSLRNDSPGIVYSVGKEAADALEQMQSTVAKYRAALEFYADEKNYHENMEIDFPFRSTKINHDRGSGPAMFYQNNQIRIRTMAKMYKVMAMIVAIRVTSRC